MANLVLSQTVEYALRASIYIAQQRPRSVRGPEVAAAVNAPRNYLGKILGTLARAGYLESSRGPAGGFRLAKGSELHPLTLVVSVFEAAEPRRCLLGHGECGKSPACTAHQRWQPIAKATDEFFARTTLADLLASPASAAQHQPREALRLVHNLT